MSCRKYTSALLVLMACSGYAAETMQLSSDQTRLLESARAHAMKYSHDLPDFICTQVTHRTTTRNMDASSGAGISGRSSIAAMANSIGYRSDTFEEQLTYVGGKENYVVLTVNGRKAKDADPMQFEGATSEGEFGSMLIELFNPTSHTVFSWERTGSVHGRHAWIYGFQVPREAGTYAIARDSDKAILVPLSGEVSIDPETGEVLLISTRLDLPAGFPIRVARRSIEFAPRQIAGKSYILPAVSLVHMEDSQQIYDNKIEFKNYHRFATESTIHFDNQDQQK